MLRTILFLVATLIALPVVAFYYDQPLSAEQADAVKTVFLVMAVVAFTCFAVSEITRNYSQVDKLWSLLPIVYTWFFALKAAPDPRTTLMAVLVTFWGLRLSFNFWRRGGYHWIPWRGEEDYRWAVLRSQNPALQKRLNWAAFNLFFISAYQNTLILLFSLPVVVAWQGKNTPLNWLDALAALLILLFITLETIADQQQYNYQQEKYRLMGAGKTLPEREVGAGKTLPEREVGAGKTLPEREVGAGKTLPEQTLPEQYARGFCNTGLWARVRHPNYAAEQAIWISFYLFSVAATGRWLNWSLAGAILLMLLFIGSSDFSEKISAGKYPEYRDYQKRVPRFIPDLF